ncbi:MAG: hypothetical protein CENE_00087 [Candidatus Celerinatantimonas neptuna]|nr:MAG: hypothetical protein CENE_00087 [Candidatus Celerinatantimonas neptuna]
MRSFKRLLLPFIAILTLMLLAGCSPKPPRQIYLDPHPSVGSARALPGMQVNLTVLDLRPQHYLMAIHTPGKEQAQLVTSANNVRKSIYQAVKKALSERDITVSDKAADTLKIEIMTLNNRTVQHPTDYIAIDQVTLKASFSSKHSQIVRQYTASRRNTGSFGVDMSEQQTQLNQTLNAVLTGILTDHKLLTQASL